MRKCRRIRDFVFFIFRNGPVRKSQVPNDDGTPKSRKNRFFSFCTKSIQITFIDFRMVPGGLLGLRESRRAPRCIILWFWALLKNQVFGPKMLTLPNRLKICFSKAERNQFSDFNMNYHVKPRQFQAHMDQFWRSVGQIFDLRSRSQNWKNRKNFFFFR